MGGRWLCGAMLIGDSVALWLVDGVADAGPRILTALVDGVL